MSEGELAAELQANKENESEWGEAESGTPVSRQKGNKRLQAMVSVRFAPQELEQLQRRAKENGQTVSAYLRSLAVRDIQDPQHSYATFGVSISSGGTYSAHVANPWIMSDGRRLATTPGQ